MKPVQLNTHVENSKVIGVPFQGTRQCENVSSHSQLYNNQTWQTAASMNDQNKLNHQTMNRRANEMSLEFSNIYWPYNRHNFQDWESFHRMQQLQRMADLDRLRLHTSQTGPTFSNNITISQKVAMLPRTSSYVSNSYDPYYDQYAQYMMLNQGAANSNDLHNKELSSFLTYPLPHAHSSLFPNFTHMPSASFDERRMSDPTKLSLSGSYSGWDSCNINNAQNHQSVTAHDKTPEVGFDRSVQQNRLATSKYASSQDKNGSNLEANELETGEDHSEDESSVDSSNSIKKPKRFLSNYNLFIRYERQLILKELEEARVAKEPCETMDRDAKWNRGNGSVEEGDIVENSDEQLDQPCDLPKRYHGIFMNRIQDRSKQEKTHGSMGFVQLSKEIARRWREVDPNVKKFFNRMAKKNRKHYISEYRKYKQKKKAFLKGQKKSVLQCGSNLSKEI